MREPTILKYVSIVYRYSRIHPANVSPLLDRAAFRSVFLREEAFMPSALEPLLAMLSLFPYLAAALVLLYLGKYVFDLTTPGIRDNEELGDKSNPAFGVFWGGYMTGLAAALSGALSRLGPSPAENLIDIAVSGVSAIALLRISMAIGNAVVLKRFSLNHEIVADRNLGAAFAFAGLFVGSGLVISGVMTGRSDSPLSMLRDIAVYWACGQVFLIGAWFVFKLLAGYDAVNEIGEKNNAAVGVSLAGFFGAVGIVLRAALTNAGSDLAAELLITSVIGLVSLLFLSLARVLSLFVILPRLRVSREISERSNLGAGIVSATIYLAVALLLGTLVTSQLL